MSRSAELKESLNSVITRVVLCHLQLRKAVASDFPEFVAVS